MKKILPALICTFIAFQVFAQEDAVTQEQTQTQEQNKPAENTAVKEHNSDMKTNAKGKPDFNKKKISLDRIEEKKWSLRVGYNYFMPDNKYLSMVQNQLKIGGAYDYNQYLQFQAFLRYGDGKKSYDISGASTQFQSTIYNIGLLATGLYPVELSFGSIAPFASIGAVYTFGSLNTTYQDGTQSKLNLSGGGILAQAGLQYSYHIIALRVYGEYLYDFTPINNPYIKSLSGFSVGVEAGIKF